MAPIRNAYNAPAKHSIATINILINNNQCTLQLNIHNRRNTYVHSMIEVLERERRKLGKV
jgi:hypothetical protein